MKKQILDELFIIEMANKSIKTMHFEEVQEAIENIKALLNKGAK